MDVVKFKRHYDIRWLSLHECVSAIITNYEPLMTLLDQERAEEEPIAVGLHTQLSSYNFVALLHLTAGFDNVTQQARALVCNMSGTEKTRNLICILIVEFISVTYGADNVNQQAKASQHAMDRENLNLNMVQMYCAKDRIPF